jgi:hypothetical protein
MSNNHKRGTDWAAKICRSWRSTIDGIFETGDLLIAAKAKMRGKFERMVEHELPFGERTAERLMAIAKDKRLRAAHSKAAHGSLLPASWRTLYELSRLNDRQLQNAFDNGSVHAEMTRQDALRLLGVGLHSLSKKEAAKVRFRHANDPEVSSRTLKIQTDEASHTLKIPTVSYAREIDVIGYKVASVPVQPLNNANFFIDLLVNDGPAIRAAVAALLTGEREADRDIVTQELAALMAALSCE